MNIKPSTLNPKSYNRKIPGLFALDEIDNIYNGV